ncbi:mRNA interferase RelE/StbE [Desulfocicer vacuolatum DSM 3385]|uniref:mRNA interferase RelE/StbE n=1 Tax=Desulfocicer vacuolatum DSM 3385 TaxID=1121400 RepID=A0A1W2D505_9BACT|nr:type II toxin-antitoxin system RelE/ParE family toxin [Desulfocicer vacuolatum]SMC92138.1 mRNA interferase RelE/StbE [Desulfocicer vacuolatum DSM 3385]
MAYKIKYTPATLKQLSKLDKPIAKKIMDYMDDRAEHPTGAGKALKGNLKGHWRHRVGNYRVISFIDDDVLTVLVVRIGHRKNVYHK